MARRNPAPAGAVTWLVNPVEDEDGAAELAFGRVFEREEDDVEMSLAKTGGNRGGRPRKNPAGLGVIVSFLLPLATGGGLGLLDGMNPRWWARIGYPARAFVLVALSVVAQKRNMPLVQGAALALAARYVALWGGQKLRVAQETKKPEEGQGDGQEAAGDDVGALGRTYEEELAEAADFLERRNAPRDMGALPLTYSEVQNQFDGLIAARSAA